MIWQLIVIAMIGYLIGSVNLSIILSKLMGKGDIREQGSGNAGTTNTLRVLGKGPAALVLIFDICKAVIAILIAKGIFALTGVATHITPILPDGMTPLVAVAPTFNIHYELGILLAAFGAILGHNFPIYYGFKGGKGIATSLGAVLMIEWPIGLVCLVFALILMIFSRMVSLGSICTAILYPVLVWFMGVAFEDSFEAKLVYTIFAICIAALAIFRHRSNIKRLFNGTENKLWKTKAEKLAEKESK